MNDRDIRREARLQRVKIFGAENAADFVAGSEAKQDFAKLDQVLADLQTAKQQQKPVLVNKQMLREALTEDFRRIADTATKIEARAKLPGFAADYRMPDTMADTALSTHARCLLGLLADDPADTPEQLAAKAARRERFVRLEMAADFATSLKADADAFVHADARNNAESLEGVESTARITQLLAEGTELVDDLDTMMRNKYGRVPATLPAWERASRVEKNPRRKSSETPPATPAPVPVAAK